MAGFIAIVAHPGETRVEEAELSALAGHYRELRGRGAGVQTLAAGDWARVACIGDAPPVKIEREGTSWSAVVGTLYASRGSIATPAEDLDGQFAAVRWSEAAGTLQLLTDSFGMHAVYVAERDGRTYASTSMLALARHLAAAPDPVGVKFFLRTGAQYGHRTHWDGIERLSQATAIDFSPTGEPVRRVYWELAVDPSIRALSKRQTIERGLEVGLALAERRLTDEPLFSADLTGGFDSRMVTAFMDRAGASFATMTVKEELHDAELARAVAAAGGWRFEEQALPADWQLGDEALREALAWGDATLEAFSLSQVLWRQRDRTRISRQVVTGGGGENFGPGPYFQELWRAGRSTKVNYDNLLSMRLLLPLDVSVFRTDPTIDAERYVRGILEDKLAPYSDELNTTQLDVVHAFREPGHFGIYRSACEAHVRGQLPCYFRDFWIIGHSASHKWRNGHQLHRGMTERLHPAVAAVETQRGGPSELLRPSNAVRFLPYYGRLAQTAVNKIRKRQTTLSRRPRTGHDAYRAALARLRSDGTLQPASMRSGALYDAAALDGLLASAERGDQVNWALVGRIATVELMLRAAGHDQAVLAESASRPA